MKTKIVLLVLLVGAAGWYVYNRLDFSQPIHMEAYVPSEECASAYEALSMEPTSVSSSDETGSTAVETAPWIVSSGENGYDIEQTVRIMNSLEVAQAQADSFTDFLEYMAKQDYRGVAKDVLETKRLLFPIIEEMNTMRKEITELSSVWFCLKNASVSAVQAVSANSSSYMVGGVLSVGDMLKDGSNAVFEHFMEQQDLKRKEEKRLDRLRRQYIAYIEAYTPVYRKYMDEWNSLCLNKDKAYINLYAGDLAEALVSAQKVLDQHPVNREGLLLKAIALIRLGSGDGDKYIFSDDLAIHRLWQADGRGEYEQDVLENPCYFTARRTLDTYLQLYPDRAAPALLLDGIIQEQMGHTSRAVALYEQAAAEYPRQAEALTDMLDSYISRTYLNQSVEGRYLLNYYRSTMEGAGIFSPNFRKAALYDRLGRSEESQEEIYKHFFRRGNQSVQDCLLSDMQYCENYLYGSFRPMLLESSYMDIKYSRSAKLMGLGKKKGKIDVELINRSDSRFENVRIFLCIHTVGMYKDDYDVVRMSQTRNVIEPYQVVRFDDVDIASHDIDDITRIRAIVMTDDKICWVDTREVKLQQSLDFKRQLLHLAENRLSAPGEALMQLLQLSPVNLEKEIATHLKIRIDKKWTGSGTLYVRFPRILALLSPSFSINPVEAGNRIIAPDEDKMAGDYIETKFTLSDADKVSDLYIYSPFVSFKISVVERNGSYEVEGVKKIG